MINVLQLARSINGVIGRKQPTHCRALNNSGGSCPNFTKDGKEYCLDHITHNNYAGKVAAELAKQAAEAEVLAKAKGKYSAKALNTTLANEIYSYVSFHGPTSVKMLVRQLHVATGNNVVAADKLVETCVKALQKAKKVSTRLIKRGKTMVLPVKEVRSGKMAVA